MVCPARLTEVTLPGARVIWLGGTAALELSPSDRVIWPSDARMMPAWLMVLAMSESVPATEYGACGSAPPRPWTAMTPSTDSGALVEKSGL